MPKPRTGQYVGPRGLVDSVADAEDIRGEAGAHGTGGTPPAFATDQESIAGDVNNKAVTPHGLSATLTDRRATEAEGEGGTEAGKFVTPAVLAAVFDDKKASASDVTAGTADKWVDSAQLKAVADDVPTAAVPRAATEQDIRDGTVGPYVDSAQMKVERDARSAVDADIERAARSSLSLSAAQQQAFRTRIGAEEIESPWVDTTIGTWNYNASPRSAAAEDTGLSVPAGATMLRVQAREGDLYETIGVAGLLSRPDVAHGRLLDDSNSIEFTAVNAAEQDDTAPMRIAHRGRVIYFRQTSAGGESTATFKDRRPRARFTAADEAKLDGIEAGAQANVPAAWDAITGKPLLPSVTDAEAAHRDADQLVVVENNDLLVTFTSPDSGQTYQWGGGAGTIRERRALANDAAVFTGVRAVRYSPASRGVTAWFPAGSQAVGLWLGGRLLQRTGGGESQAQIPWSDDATTYVQVDFGALPGGPLDLAGENPAALNVQFAGRELSGPRLQFATLPPSAAGQPPVLSGRSLPARPKTGQVFRLLAAASSPGWAEGTLSSQRTTGGGTIDTFTPTNADTDLPMGRPGIIGFINYTGSRIIVWPVVDSDTPASRLPASIQTLSEDGTRRDWTLERVNPARITEFQTTVQFARPWDYGDVVGLNVTLADGTKWVPDQQLTAGLVAWDGFEWSEADRALTLDAVDARIADWARAGNTDALPDAKRGWRRLTAAQYRALPAPRDPNTLFIVIG